MTPDERRFFIVRGTGAFMLRVSLILGLAVLGVAWWLKDTLTGRWQNAHLVLVCVGMLLVFGGLFSDICMPILYVRDKK